MHMSYLVWVGDNYSALAIDRAELLQFLAEQNEICNQGVPAEGPTPSHEIITEVKALFTKCFSF